MYKVILIDDEPLARQLLKTFLQAHSQFEVVASEYACAAGVRDGVRDGNGGGWGVARPVHMRSRCEGRGKGGDGVWGVGCGVASEYACAVDVRDGVRDGNGGCGV